METLGGTAHDLDLVLGSRHANGADFWATADGKLGIEGPLSTVTALQLLAELRVPSRHEAVAGAAALVLATVGDDGRARLAPHGQILPCHTARAAAALCGLGFADDQRVNAMLAYLAGHRYDDGGWRCNRFPYGRGPSTEFSNPGVTLLALDALRWTDARHDSALDSAVETLLDHWTVRVPTGPCAFGIGSRFLQVEYPFLRYNLFYYVHVLSFYPKATTDARFAEALAALSRKLDDAGQLVVERPHRGLGELSICRQGEASVAATARYREIVERVTHAAR